MWYCVKYPNVRLHCIKLWVFPVLVRRTQCSLSGVRTRVSASDRVKVYSVSRHLDDNVEIVNIYAVVLTTQSQFTQTVPSLLRVLPLLLVLSNLIDIFQGWWWQEVSHLASHHQHYMPVLGVHKAEIIRRE